MAQAAAWLGIAPDHPFGLAALPYGSYATAQHAEQYRVGVAIGDYVLDLTTATERLLAGRAHLFASGSLDDFLEAGERAWGQVRAGIRRWLSEDRCRSAIEDLLIPQTDVSFRVPFTVGDYVDFYASEQHAINLGRIFRPGSEPLAASWRHQPLGYHGRSGTMVVSGTRIRRPCGPSCFTPGMHQPEFCASERLDFEAELGFVVGVHSHLGDPIPVDRFAEHVFGVCLVNDWSARDIQSWESVPLGPFLGKSFATSISPWILPLAALEHARVRPRSRDARLMGYLAETADWGLDIDMEVRLNGRVISRPPYAAMFWSPAQMLAHMTVNGASTRSGDFYASGTISGPDPAQCGSLIELAWNASNPVPLSDGSSRSWLEDGDEVTITATAPGTDGVRIGLGSVTGTIMPAVRGSAEGAY